MNTIEKKSVNVGQYVSKQEVDTLVRTYKQERWANNSDRMGKADSLSVWFTVEDLEDFLETVKANGGNGVRFHFGVHTADTAAQPEFEGRQTLVMVGNRSNDGTYASSKELFSNKNGKPELVAVAGGILCPPWCGSTGTVGAAALIVKDGEGISVM